MDKNPSITPRYRLLDDKEQVAAAASALNFPVILKPANLVKSLLVLKCDTPEDLRRGYEHAIKNIEKLYKEQRVYGRQPRLIAEEYIIGQTCSIAAFVDEVGKPYFCDGIVALTNAQDIGVDDNYIYGRFLPAGLDGNLEKELFRVAEKGIQALGMASSPAHVELIYNEQGVKLIEIGARVGGYRPRIYQMSYGLDLISQEVGLALGRKPKLAGAFKAYSAVYELFPEQEGLFDEITYDSETSEFTYYSVKVQPSDRVGPSKNGYKAAAVVVVQSPDKQEYNRLCSKAERMKVKIR